MTDVIEVNCVTGCATRRNATPAERKQIQKDRAEAVARDKVDQREEQRKQDILAKVAEATGVTVSELKDALRS